MSFVARSLYNHSGKRLYLTPSERARFLEAIEHQAPETRTFAKFLVLTGCRVSEALSVRAEHIDFEEKRVAIETLKQRRRGVWRRIPLPDSFLQELKEAHGLHNNGQCKRLWSFQRTTAYERIKSIMTDAAVLGPQACPKGLRHTFGTHAVLNDIPLTILMSWMGHSRIQTTQIYLQLSGEEEYSIASRMWQKTT